MTHTLSIHTEALLHHHDEKLKDSFSHSVEKKTQRILTVRAISGLSGDMILSGLAVMAGLNSQDLNNLLKEISLSSLDNCITLENRAVKNISGIGCCITLPHEHEHRTLTDIRKIIQESTMPDKVKALSIETFTLLAQAEAAVHNKKVDDIAFHEVGALDSILDICLSCYIFTIIDPGEFICSPLPLADGFIKCAHGFIPSPAPAVLKLLDGIAVRGFTDFGETVTPTALALLKALDAQFGLWPSMTVNKTVISYGTRVFTEAPNGAIWALGTS